MLVQEFRTMFLVRKGKEIKKDEESVTLWKLKIKSNSQTWQEIKERGVNVTYINASCIDGLRE